MPFTIRDGAGGTKEAKVTNDNRLATTAISETEADRATALETRYNVNTGTVTLTDANDTTVLYLRNDEDSDLIITALIYNLGNALGVLTGDMEIDVIRNPISGDIITNATSVDIVENQNHGSNRSLAATAYKGASADALITGGSVSISTLSSSGTGRIVIALGAMTLPKGSSLAVNIKPRTGTTSQSVQVAAACYVKTFDV